MDPRPRPLRRSGTVDTVPSTPLAQQPDPKLATWSPHIATLAEQVVTETMDVADANTVTLLRSRTPVQEVLNTIDERQAG